MVRFERVSYAVAGRPVLRDVTFRIEPGETLILLGRSGAGKTTALKMINRLVAPTSGTVEVDGRATTDWDPILLRRQIGYAIQEVGLFPHLTVARNIAMVPELLGWPAERIAARIEELLAAVDLDPRVYASRYPRQLSGGQRQRVGVARALAADPPLLLFDEPFGGLDPVTRLELQRQFLLLRRRFRKTAVFVTHDVREALALGTRIALMHDGVLDTVAPPSEFVHAASEEARAFLACLDWKMEV